MSIEQITDHIAQAKALLITQYQGQPNLEALLSAFIAQVQDLENMLWDLIDKRILSAATGDQLDILGSIVGQKRLGYDDDAYRLLVRVRILLNTSSGTPDNILTVVNLLIENDFAYTEWYPAGMSIVIADELTADADLVALVVSLARSAGIHATIEYTLTDDDYTFTFASGDVEEADSDKGWSNDGGTSGGKFADAEVS